MRTVLILLIVIGLAAGGGAYYFKYVGADPVTNFRTATVKRGDLLPTISATGTVEPEEVVDVGAQVQGRITEFGIDARDPEKKKPVDYRSAREEGPDAGQDRPRHVQGPARPGQGAARALQGRSLAASRPNLTRAERDWERAESLHPAKAIADTDYDLAEANYETAKANVDVGKATIKQDEAALEMAKTNLDYTIIQSPVDGEIIDRRVNIGQTVVSSLSAPSLFLIAKDLTRIQVWASVNEADIGTHLSRTCRCDSPSTPIRAKSSAARCCKSG